MRKLWVLVLALFFSGSLPGETAPQLPVAIRVEIDGSIQRRYTQPDKIEAVLNFLRQQENLGKTHTDPERLTGDRYTIRVCMSDGREHVYQQRADRYFSADYHGWQKIYEEHGKSFALLLRENESDV